MTKIEILTYSDEEPTIIEVEEYDAQEIADKINTNEYQVLVLGDNVYSKVDIKKIRKIS